MQPIHPRTAAMVLIAAGTLAAGCSKSESAANNAGTTTGASATAASTPGAASAQGASTSADSIVRGTVKEASDSVLALTTPAGDVRVTLVQPLKVYTRQPASLSRVTDNVFVGVTSVPQPDGSQRATEIHIFPQELRGLGEGSRPMSAPAGGGSRGTMTNGSVAASRMTNGAARMTNGTSRGAAGGTITVQYNGGSQTITVPQGVTVTEIVPTTAKLAPGTSVIAIATKRPDGTLQASRVMIAGGEQRPK